MKRPDSRLVALVLLASAAAGGCSSDGAADAPGEAIVAEALQMPSGPGSGQPHFALTTDGRIVMSWLEADGAGHALNFSVRDGEGWGPTQTIARGDNWFVNWADLPSVQPIDADTWFAHWLVYQTDSFAYDIAYAASGDGGQTWDRLGNLNDDTAPAEHGFVAFFPWDDDVGAVWLDNRVVGSMSIDELIESEEFLGMELRYARFRRDGSAIERGIVDELVCDCCQTDAVSTSNGPLIAYRDRSEEEVRDIVVRSMGSDRSWGPARALGPDGWTIDGCPVNGPAIDARGSSVAAAWYTAPNYSASIRFARSDDGGRTFSAAIELDGAGSFGHVDVTLVDDGDAWVSWWRRSEAGGMELIARRVDADGRPGEPVRVAASTERAPADVPQMAAVADELVFVWTEGFGEEAELRGATVSLP